MKILIGLAAVFGAAVALSSAAQAMPLATSPDGSNPLITHVAQGCGPGFHRGPRGRCVRNFAPRVMPRVMPRRCTVVRTMHGPRRVCR